MNEVLHTLFYLHFDTEGKINSMPVQAGIKIYLCFRHSVVRSKKFYIHTETRMVGHYNAHEFICWDCEHD